jgi:predicted metalloendopeptidase
MEVSEVTETRLHRLLNEQSAQLDEAPVSEAGKLGAFYTAFMNEQRVDALGARSIQLELNAIRSARDHTALA